MKYYILVFLIIVLEVLAYLISGDLYFIFIFPFAAVLLYVGLKMVGIFIMGQQTGVTYSTSSTHATLHGSYEKKTESQFRFYVAQGANLIFGLIFILLGLYGIFFSITSLFPDSSLFKLLTG